MSADLAPLEAGLAGLLARLTPTARRALARQIATTLRSSQQKRIAAQLNPDGTPFAPRKPQLRGKTGRVRRQMFSKLRTSRYLKTEASADGAVVGFVSQVERIARVHQLGLRDRVRPQGPEYSYPARALLGVSPSDVAAVQAQVLEMIVGSGAT